MKYVRTIVAIGAICILLGPGLSAKAVKSAEGSVSLCATYSGPAFIGPDESMKAVAVHAGQYPGISFVSLDTGQIEGYIAAPQRFLAASMAADGKLLTFAVSDSSGIRIRSFDVPSRSETPVQLFFPNQTAYLAVFTQDAKSLLGVTTKGDVFRIDVKANKLDILERVAEAAQAIAVSANGRLYVAGRGISVIDVNRLSFLSTLTQERLLLGVAVSPDDKMLAVRNKHSLEILDATTGGRVGDSVVVDSNPDALSSSLVNIAFSPDGSQLFYARASYVESEIFSLSLPALHIEKRSKMSPLPSAIAVMPSHQWVLLTTGSPGKEQIEAFDMKTLAVKFQAALGGGGTKSAHFKQRGCLDTAQSTH